MGIAESIVANGRVFPENDIYQAWSGLFASAAFVKVASGWNDLLLYATVWGAVAAAIMVLAVRAVAGQFHGEGQHPDAVAGHPGGAGRGAAGPIGTQESTLEGIAANRVEPVHPA